MENVNFKKIMVATDGSICSRLAANRGIELARFSGGPFMRFMWCPLTTFLPWLWIFLGENA
jgi:nucleotide-binding universal stress UspA family protein